MAAQVPARGRVLEILRGRGQSAKEITAAQALQATPVAAVVLLPLARLGLLVLLAVLVVLVQPVVSRDQA